MYGSSLSGRVILLQRCTGSMIFPFSWSAWEWRERRTYTPKHPAFSSLAPLRLLPADENPWTCDMRGQENCSHSVSLLVGRAMSSTPVKSGSLQHNSAQGSQPTYL